MTQDTTETLKIEAPKNPEEEDLAFELIEVEETVSIENLLEWKETGNYTLIEYHIRKGNIEMLPKADLIDLVAIQTEHQIMMQSIQLFLEALQPMLDKQAELQPYINLDSPFKINVGKIIGELTMAKISKPPIAAIMETAVNKELMQLIPVKKLQAALVENEINFQQFLDFLEMLGLYEMTTKQIGTNE